LSPGPIERMKPYFKPRPRAGTARAQAAQAQAAAAQPAVAQPAPAPAAAAQPQAAPVQAAAAQPQAPGVDGAGLEARRQQLASRFAELQSDLGGLVYEMAIRDSFKQNLVVRRAAELQAVDQELSAVERQLGLAPAGAAAAACPSCGAAVQAGSQFCARCGSVVAAPQPAGGVG
jgi:zinc-ribbon domain